MPVQGFGEGYLQSQSIANERKKIQMAAESQQRLFAARDAVHSSNEDLEVFRQQTAQVVEGLQQELDNNRADFQMLKLEKAATSMLGGDLSHIRDTFHNQDLKEIYMHDDGIKDFFGNNSGLASVRTYNPNDPEEKKAYDQYIKDIGGGTPDFDASSIGENVYTYEMADGSIQVYDRTAIARALGLGAESSSIRQMIEAQDKIDEDLMNKQTTLDKDKTTLESGKKEIIEKGKEGAAELQEKADAAKRNLAIEDPQGALAQAQIDKIEAETLGLGGTDGVAVLTDVKKILPTVNSGGELYDAIISKHPTANFTEDQANTMYQRELGDRKAKLAEGKSGAELNKFYAGIARKQKWNFEGLTLPEDETEADQVIGAAIQRQIGNTIDLSFDAKGELSLVRKQRKPFESEVNRGLLAPVVEDINKISAKNQGKGFSEWDEADRNQYLDLYDKGTSFDKNQFPPLTTEERQALDTNNQLVAGINRFVERANEVGDLQDVKGIKADIKNFFAQYQSAQSLSPDERGARVAALQLDFTALISAASLANNGRLPKWVYDELRDIQASTPGTDISAALEGAIAQMENVAIKASTRATSGGRLSRVLFGDTKKQAEKAIINLDALLRRETGDVEDDAESEIGA